MGHLSGINLVGRKPGILLGDQSSTNHKTFANLLLQHKSSPQLEENTTIHPFLQARGLRSYRLGGTTHLLSNDQKWGNGHFICVCLHGGGKGHGFQIMLESGMVSVKFFSKSMSGARAMRQYNPIF